MARNRDRDLERGADLADARPRGRAGHLRIEQELALAQENRELTLNFQPIVRIADGSVAGFEALIRWQHPKRGMIAPDVFIPVAERSGSIVSLGRWVIRTAIAALAAMQGPNDRRAGGEPLFMTINVSSRQFSDAGLVDVLDKALTSHSVDAQRVHLEITESGLFDSIDEAAALMQRCKQLGVKLSVDDFGTGYSALSYLYRLPVTGVKLARQFICDLEAYPESAKIVRAIARLAGELNLDVIAEGIETASQATAVQGLGIGLGQGFHYAAGLPLLVASNYITRSAESLRLKRGGGS